jgi:hypothetical protein
MRRWQYYSSTIHMLSYNHIIRTPLIAPSATSIDGAKNPLAKLAPPGATLIVGPAALLALDVELREELEDEELEDEELV